MLVKDKILKCNSDISFFTEGMHYVIFSDGYKIVIDIITIIILVTDRTQQIGNRVLLIGNE